MRYLSRDEIRQLSATELLVYVNEYLVNGGTMNQFEKKHHTTKKYIKTKLDELNVRYNQATKQYEPITVSEEETNINQTNMEVVDMPQNAHNTAINNDNSLEVVSLLADIKTLLESQNSRLGDISDEVVQIKVNTEAQIALQPMQTNETETTRVSVDTIKPIKTGEDLITRNVKLYPSIIKRLKRLVDDTDYQQQQVLSALLDEILTKYGY